jgi:hypothetical protein
LFIPVEDDQPCSWLALYLLSPASQFLRFGLMMVMIRKQENISKNTDASRVLLLVPAKQCAE